MWIALLLVVMVVAGLVAVISSRPGTFRVERSALIAAPAPIVFGQVNDFHNWEAWSPWAKIDPNMAVTYEGTDSGVGAIYKWSGDKKAGEGRMEILESHPNSLVRIDLRFLRPFPATNATEFALRPEGDGTHVTWTMSGTNNFVLKAMNLTGMNMDRMIGGDFERGLAAMATASETKTVQSLEPDSATP